MKTISQKNRCLVSCFLIDNLELNVFPFLKRLTSRELLFAKGTIRLYLIVHSFNCSDGPISRAGKSFFWLWCVDELLSLSVPLRLQVYGKS